MAEKDGLSIDEFFEEFAGTGSTEPDNEEELDNEDIETDDEEDSEEDSTESDGSEEDESDEDEDDNEDDSSDDEDGEEAGDASDDSDKEDGEDEPEVDPRDDTIAKLTALIESQALSQMGAVAPPQPADKDQGGQDDSGTPQTLAEVIGDVDFNEFQDNPQSFIEMIGRVVDFTQKQTAQSTRQELNNVVSQQTAQVVSQQKMIDDFYRDHSELAHVKRVVALVAKSVGTENPKLGIAEVLAESAKRTYAMLGIDPKAKAPASKKPTRRGVKKPAKQRRTSSKRAKPSKDTRTKMQKQIDDLLDF